MQQSGPWRNDAQYAFMFTFDFDAETLWFSRDPSNWKRPAFSRKAPTAAKWACPGFWRCCGITG
jgi:peptidoglycan-N-acetylglucosamine deacetylase